MPAPRTDPAPTVALAAPEQPAPTLDDRLRRIIETCAARDLATNGGELWFGTDATDDLEIRLGCDLDAAAYDRSANLTISYGGGRSDDRPPDAFYALVARIKAIDDTPIADAAAAFAAAVGGIVDAAGGGPTGSAAARERSDDRATPTPQTGEQRQAHSQAHWERPRTRRLNVVFLDLCAALIGTAGELLPALHWGYWPTATPAPEGYDPFEGFARNLLAHVPDSAVRIMDVGCGLGVSARHLSARGKLVTAVSPVPHHCAAIADARLPGVDVRCARFEDLAPDRVYDLLLFSESVNHFLLDDAFFERCARFLAPSGHLLLADDLSEERIGQIERQTRFPLLRSVDISANVEPTGHWWAERMRIFSAGRDALLSILDLEDAAAAARVRDILDNLDSSELKVLFSGRAAPPTSKGRYMIYLLQRA